ncbi:MAG TPA: YodC family protein [Pararobbsia sp.]|nr:YodC family protein [Pararobbsia sp.]
MTTRYEIGDVVRLKSGGQPMTVNQVGPVAFAPGVWLICQWFDLQGQLHQEMFHEDTVQRVEEPVVA